MLSGSQRSEAMTTCAAQYSMICKLVDPAAAEHEIAVVEYRSLPGSHRPLGLIKPYFYAVRIGGRYQRGGSRNVLVPDLHLGAPGSHDRRDRNPIDLSRVERHAQEIF